MGHQQPVGRGQRAQIIAVAMVVLLAASSLGVLAMQVEVSDADVGATRACGSALDGLVDRSGWETWWASDLDEPDDRIRSALVRTTKCPDAVNARIAGASIAGAASMLLALVVVGRHRSRRRDASAPERPRERLDRLGRATTLVGAVLTVAGVLAVVLLVADADSTLFLYTDRFVVAVVGLIVLVPTVALIAIGRVVTVLAEATDHIAETAADDGIDSDAN